MSSLGIVVAPFRPFALPTTEAPTSRTGAAIGGAIAVTASPRRQGPLVRQSSGDREQVERRVRPFSDGGTSPFDQSVAP